jgi:hypothetical protein
MLKDGGMVMNNLQKAIDELDHVLPGEVFLVKDLFKGYEWNRISIGDRRSLGLGFLHEVKHGELFGILDILPKSSANQQLYVKKESLQSEDTSHE